MRKKGILPSQTPWMDLDSIILSALSQTEKDQYYMISLTCGSKEAKVIETEQHGGYQAPGMEKIGDAGQGIKPPMIG